MRLSRLKLSPIYGTNVLRPGMPVFNFRRPDIPEQRFTPTQPIQNPPPARRAEAVQSVPKASVAARDTDTNDR